MEIADFQKSIWEFYAANKRDMPWRSNTDPYWVLVSEVMLQQTQVSRVIPKFEAFMAAFPTVQALAAAPLSDVLGQWSGLGYNRRAQYLLKAAQVITKEHKGIFPQNRSALEALPGIGPNTAGAIMAYAFNRPVVFIETNIRSVFLHHFFNDASAVDDREIRQLVELTLDYSQPREWYWALMDYGSYLKQTTPNPSRRSKHHAKQSRFEGSPRQLRGKILKRLLVGSISRSELLAYLNDPRTEEILAKLINESLVFEQAGKLNINDN